MVGRAAAVGSVVGAAAILSSSYTLTKVALLDVPPLTIGFIRFAVAALVLAGWVHLVRRYPHPRRSDQWPLALGGFLGITLYFSIENIGVDLATATDAALLVASYPAITALLELLVYRRRTSLRGLLGIVLAVLGVYVVVGYTPGAGPGRRIGDVLLIVSGIVWALYNFVTRNVANRYPTPVVLCYQARAGALGFLPLALFEHHHWHLPTHAGNTMASLAALALLCSIAGLGLYAKGLQRLPPTTAVNLLNLVPVFGLIIALVALGEHVTIVQIIGGLIVILGVTISARQKSSQGATATS
jgi:drug/metabolite transporter (DMT)-like permease